jgi:RimJ/RimL family protein N-acetyltransferase
MTTSTPATVFNEFGLPVGAAVPNWVPRSRPTRMDVLIGRTCRVVALDPAEHSAALFAAYSEAADGRAWTYLGIERPSTIEIYRAHADACAASEDPLHYAIIDETTGLAVGTASYLRIDPANGAIEVGWIAYSPKLQQTVMGTEAMYLMMRHAFDTLGYRRYEWKCDSLNAPSHAAAKRFGFQFEGLFRQAVVYKNRNRDTSWFSIIDGDWPGLRGAFEHWLDPANFDADGRQLATLQSFRR